jgi:glycosyltransferase involved in cell wall biosynthesis
MRICIAAASSLDGSGYATRIQSMLDAYVDRFDVSVVHFRFDSELELPAAYTDRLDYRPVLLRHRTRLDHRRLLPPLAAAVAQSSGNFPSSLDVLQVEGVQLWPLWSEAPAVRRVLVMHDDERMRMARLAHSSRTATGRLACAAMAWKCGRLQLSAVREADETWFVSRVEMNRLGGDARAAVCVPNGAPSELFAVPTLAGTEAPVLAFVGPAAYQANAEAVGWLTRAVWPAVRRVVPEAELRLVGRGWDSLGPVEGVTVRGYAARLDEELRQARVVVAPLLAGGGTKVKVIEGMAAARPVVTTSIGAEGIPPSPGLIAEDQPERMAAAVVRLLTDRREASRLGAQNRAAVASLRWEAIWDSAVARLEGERELCGA